MNGARLAVDYKWVAVERLPGEPYLFPHKTTEHMKNRYSKPAIYRWGLYSASDKRSSIYVGETENLFKRVGGYLHPGPSQQTNLRLNVDFHSVVEQGRTVSLDQLDFSPFRINAVMMSPENLHDSFRRRMMEAFLIADFLASDECVYCSLMNVKTNPIERSIRRAIKIISETTSSAPPPTVDQLRRPSRVR